MQTSGWFQLALYIVALAAITKPMGLYLLQVLDANGRTWFDPALRPLERFTYRLMGVKASQEHDWKQYTRAMLLFSLVSGLFTYAILRLQHLLPFNPQGHGHAALGRSDLFAVDHPGRLRGRRRSEIQRGPDLVTATAQSVGKLHPPDRARACN